MSQDLILDESKTGSTTTSGTTGSTCQKSGLYRATDGKIEFIVFFAIGDIFSFFPGGNANKKCTWYKLSKASDGSRTSFTSVKVVAGSI